jgi:hypothetical protein
VFNGDCKGAGPFAGKFFMLDSMTETAVVVQKAYEWNLWILPKVEKFPRSYRFSIGQNLVETSLDLLMHLVDATGCKRRFTFCMFFRRNREGA